jgi:hypothetical protein
MMQPSVCPYCGRRALAVALPLRPGRPSERAQRIQAIVEAIRSGAPTRRLAAQQLGRVNRWGEETSDFRRDVRAAGGMDRIRRLAEDGREPI